MRRLYPLTLKEQEFAAIHIDLVDKFLRHERLDPNEYYDIVIFGYLEAVQKQHREPISEERQNFNALAKLCMKYAVSRDWQYWNTEKRHGNPFSLDYLPTSTDDDDFSFHDLIGDATKVTEGQVVDGDLVARILAVTTPREREVIALVCQGYKIREVAEILRIARKTVSKTIYNFRVKAKAVRDDQEVIRSPQWVRNKEKIQARNRIYQATYRAEINAKNRIGDRTYRATHPEEMRAKDRA